MQDNAAQRDQRTEVLRFGMESMGSLALQVIFSVAI